MGRPAPGRAARWPLLYEVATRPWLDRLSRREGRRVTLADVPQAELDRIAAAGFDYLWPMGVWRTSAEAARIAREQPWLRDRWAAAFPRNAGEPELVASPYAISEYGVDEAFGGDEALGRLRERLARAGVGLILDFVAHHTATDAPWVTEHPEWYVAGDAEMRARDPEAYRRDSVPGAGRWIARCRDPYFPPWTDAAPLDYRIPAVHEAMTTVLLALADRCDGVRPDMAMLTLVDVFRSTWEGRSLPPLGPVTGGEFWADAIGAVRARRPGFLFIAEAYWDLEWRLQQLGFDYAYDTRFRDRLVGGDGPGLAAHLCAEDEFQRRLVRFLENHDEARAAAILSPERHRSGAVLAATVPGLFLVHDGQLEGARFRSPVQFARRRTSPWTRPPGRSTSSCSAPSRRPGCVAAGRSGSCRGPPSLASRGPRRSSRTCGPRRTAPSSWRSSTWATRPLAAGCDCRSSMRPATRPSSSTCSGRPDMSARSASCAIPGWTWCCRGTATTCFE